MNSNWRKARMAWAGLALAGAVALNPGVAGADGAQTPVGAPAAPIGVQLFGNNNDPRTAPYQDYYRLPTLLNQDLVTLAAINEGSGTQRACLAADIDQFSWEDAGCNAAPSQTISRNGSRLQLRVNRTTSNAYLRIMTGNFRYWTGGPYQFTVESIQHRVGLVTSAPNPLPVGGTVSVTARLTNGAAVPNGLLVSLSVAVDGRTYVYRARTSGGRATFQLDLPDSAAEKVASVRATSAATPQLEAGAALAQNIKIVK